MLNVFEGFSGIGVFTIALEEMGIEYNLIGTSEVDKYAILSYDAIHNKSIKLSNDNLSDNQMISYFKKKMSVIISQLANLRFQNSMMKY